jgi:glycine/D-amino acid oxidase-like deaminating enzyme
VARAPRDPDRQLHHCHGPLVRRADAAATDAPDRIVSDTRKVVFCYRASPDRQPTLFGGRISVSETDPVVSGPLLHADMVKSFPELGQTRISHSWCGLVAYTSTS